MSILRSSEGGPLGVVTDSIVKKEYQRRGAVHWHMLIWVEQGTAPPHAVMAEMPRASDTSDVRAAYLRKLLKTCYNTERVTHPVVSRVVMGRYCPSASMGFHLKYPMKLSVLMKMELDICMCVDMMKTKM